MTPEQIKIVMTDWPKEYAAARFELLSLLVLHDGKIARRMNPMWIREAKEAERRVLNAKSRLKLEDLHELADILPDYEYEIIEQHLNPEAYEDIIMPWEADALKDKAKGTSSNFPWDQ